MTIAPLVKDLSLVLGVSGLMTLLFQKIKQPVVLGYLISGILLSPIGRNAPWIQDVPNIKVLGELGVIFLMFTLGLEFNFKKLVRVGPAASVTAWFEVSFMLFLGYSCGKLLGWATFDCLYLGAMMAISSTTIIVKSLHDLGVKTRRFAEMILGVLIVEDLLAILILVGLSTLKTIDTFSPLSLLSSAFQLIVIVGGWFVVGYFLVPRFMKWVGKIGSEELLTVLSIGLCLCLAVLAARFHYSVALGAFIMGSILSESTESHRIEELTRPLRDLFVAVFFVSVGMMIDIGTFIQNLPTILIASFALVMGKVFAVSTGAMLSGQPWKMALQVGFGLAQMGEFSFIIAALGTGLGVISPNLYPIAIGISIITTALTPLFIRHSHKVAVHTESYLPLRFRNTLEKYIAFRATSRADTSRQTITRKSLLRFILNGLLITSIFVLTHEWNTRYGWILAFVAAVPSFWAMFFSFGHLKDALNYPPSQRVTIILVQLLSLIWLASLSSFYFPLKAIAIGILVCVLIFVALSFRQLGDLYHWLEKSFLNTFEQQPKSRKSIDLKAKLAPWDAHLVRLKIHPNSKVAGKSLGEVGFRANFQLSVVVIKRGIRTLVAPKPTDHIYPSDELLVLGTDDKIERARAILENPSDLDAPLPPLEDFQLTQILIHPESTLQGATIKDSKFKEEIHGIIVGLERGPRRMINPNADLVIEAGDILWVVQENTAI